MRHSFFYIFALCISLASATATAQTTKLPTPNMKRHTLSVMETFQQRKSDRAFSTRSIDRQLLSDLLWCVQGKNREDGKLTTPTCRNWQEIRLYVFDNRGVSLYDPQAHSLTTVARGDNRKLLTKGQEWANDAPVCFVMVADLDKPQSYDERSREMAAVDVGICTQNICLACAAFGLNTVPRASMDREAIQRLLKLSGNQLPIMNNPIGYPAK
ncbi:MAG: nitroreductase family protein [Bacteroidaceae bacterium]|nr:nitroreductase family protein [Bacteroidaceae bacterium]